MLLGDVLVVGVQVENVSQLKMSSGADEWWRRELEHCAQTPHTLLHIVSLEQPINDQYCCVNQSETSISFVSTNQISIVKGRVKKKNPKKK